MDYSDYNNPFTRSQCAEYERNKSFTRMLSSLSFSSIMAAYALSACLQYDYCIKNEQTYPKRKQLGLCSSDKIIVE